jgi:hypothetical protein
MSMKMAFILYMVAVVVFAVVAHRSPSWTVRPRADRPLAAAGIIGVWVAAAVLGVMIPEFIHTQHLTNLAPYTGLGFWGRLAQGVGLVALVFAAVRKTPLFAFVAGFGGVCWGVLSLFH